MIKQYIKIKACPSPFKGSPLSNSFQFLTHICRLVSLYFSPFLSQIQTRCSSVWPWPADPPSGSWQTWPLGLWAERLLLLPGAASARQQTSAPGETPPWSADRQNWSSASPLCLRWRPWCSPTVWASPSSWGCWCSWTVCWQFAWSLRSRNCRCAEPQIFLSDPAPACTWLLGSVWNTKEGQIQFSDKCSNKGNPKSLLLRSPICPSPLPYLFGHLLCHMQQDWRHSLNNLLLIEQLCVHLIVQPVRMEALHSADHRAKWE